jgi:hypothetical protein
LLAVLLLTFGARNANATFGVDCTEPGNPGPTMTIQIFNNSTDYDIFPLLLAGTASANDEWMEACFRIAASQIPDPAKSTLYPRANQYRMYIKCCGGGETGIPPSGSVQITLPLYSPLVQTIFPDPAKSGQPIEQFIDWWQGGNIIIYAVPTGSGYPDTLAKHWNEDANPANNRIRNPTRNSPTCGGVNGATVTCGLHVFTSVGGIVGWEPEQLLEYTLGAAGIDASRPTNRPDLPLRIWNPENVDYDVSNVNNVYLPAAMEPFGNKLSFPIKTCCGIGYVGSIATIGATFTAIDSWRSSSLGMNWPFYVDDSIPPNQRTTPPKTTPRKVPSPLEIFAVVQDNKGSFNDAWNTTSRFSPAPSTSPQIIRMKALLELCVGGRTSPICGRINDVIALLRANYANYVTVYNQSVQKISSTWTDDWGCTLPAVTPLTEPLLLAQLYGWNGFNAVSGCKAAANRLEQTPGYKPGDSGYKSGDPLHDYTAAKAEFDQLHYWYNDFRVTGDYGQWTTDAADYGQFNPYVPLIHGSAPFMNAPYTYAYSVDDAFGNMQTDGTGLIIAVGGPQNLPNPNHVTHEVQFTPGYTNTIAPNNPFAGLTITMDKYIRCGGVQSDFNPRHESTPFTTFIVPQGEENTTPVTPPPNSVVACQIMMADSVGRIYRIRVKDFPSKFLLAPQDRTGFPDANTRTTQNAAFIDCSGNPADSDAMDYCLQVFPYQAKDPMNPHAPSVFYISMGAPGNCNHANDKPLCAAACAKQGNTCADK